MTRRLLAILLALAALALAPVPVSADELVPARKPTITLNLASTGMAAVHQPFRIAVTPTPSTEGVTAALQVKSASGYVTQQRLRLDPRGRATGQVVSDKTAVRTYRAVLVSARGRVLATSTPVTVTWAPLTYTAALACGRSSAPIRVDIPCTITFTPTVRLDRMVAFLQVQGRTEWITIGRIPVSARGIMETDVEGLQPGIGRYRVLLVRDVRVITESPTVTIAYSAP